MDCKNALTEANGDFETAIDILRKKGQKIAAKRGDNDAREGLIIAQSTSDKKAGVILTLNCETDFVAKNDGYVSLVQSLVDKALATLPETVEELKALPYDDRLTVDEKITEQIGVIGEKLDLSSYAVLRGEQVVSIGTEVSPTAETSTFSIISPTIETVGNTSATPNVLTATFSLLNPTITVQVPINVTVPAAVNVIGPYKLIILSNGKLAYQANKNFYIIL